MCPEKLEAWFRDRGWATAEALTESARLQKINDEKKEKERGQLRAEIAAHEDAAAKRKASALADYYATVAKNKEK